MVIPELPEEVRPSGLNELHETESLKVGKVELLSYPSIEDYDDYLQKIIKDQRDPLNVAGRYEMIFSGFNNGPIREFLFQYE